MKENGKMVYEKGKGLKFRIMEANMKVNGKMTRRLAMVLRLMKSKMNSESMKALSLMASLKALVNWRGRMEKCLKESSETVLQLMRMSEG